MDKCTICGALRPPSTCYVCGDFKMGDSGQQPSACELGPFVKSRGALDGLKRERVIVQAYVTFFVVLGISWFFAMATYGIQGDDSNIGARNVVGIITGIPTLLWLSILCMPTAIALYRKRRNIRTILILNFPFFGITPAVALWMALESDPAERAADLVAHLEFQQSLSRPLPLAVEAK
jgi:hypothetical protein